MNAHRSGLIEKWTSNVGRKGGSIMKRLIVLVAVVVTSFLVDRPPTEAAGGPSISVGEAVWHCIDYCSEEELKSQPSLLVHGQGFTPLGEVVVEYSLAGSNKYTVYETEAGENGTFDLYLYLLDCSMHPSDGTLFEVYAFDQATTRWSNVYPIYLCTSAG